MSIEQRLRNGLSANTEHLQPDLDRELAALLGRARRRRRVRTAGLGLAVAAAAAAGVIWLPGVVDSIRAGDDPGPATRQSDGAARPAELTPGPLEPGTYAEGFIGLDNLQAPRVVIDVPDGFSGYSPRSAPTKERSGSLVSQGVTSQFRGVGFWTPFEVATNPCDSNELEYPGATVRDLATALAAPPLRNATDPVPVSIDGYDGLYLTWSVPTDIDNCLGGNFDGWTAGSGIRAFRLQQTPGQVDRVWILNVEGYRLIIDAHHAPATTKDQIAELTRMVESIRFTNVPDQ